MNTCRALLYWPVLISATTAPSRNVSGSTHFTLFSIAKSSASTWAAASIQLYVDTARMNVIAATASAGARCALRKSPTDV